MEERKRKKRKDKMVDPQPLMEQSKPILIGVKPGIRRQSPDGYSSLKDDHALRTFKEQKENKPDITLTRQNGVLPRYPQPSRPVGRRKDTTVDERPSYLMSQVSIVSSDGNKRQRKMPTTTRDV